MERGGEASGVERVKLSPPKASKEELQLIHPPEYVKQIERFCQQGGGRLDPDTWASTESWEAARRAAGAGLEAVRLLRETPDATAFLAIRPPGHHALAKTAMGFCLFNNIALTAASLSRDDQRVAIVDWDVHHGNGTEALLPEMGKTLYISLHQSPFYPGTGTQFQRYALPSGGQTLNIPLPPATAGDLYRQAFDQLVMPALQIFQPDWVLISAGYDAYVDDPLAGLRLIPGDYGYLSGRLLEIVPGSRIIAFLEGGYSLVGLEDSVSSTLRALTGTPGVSAPPLASPGHPIHEELVDNIERGLPEIEHRYVNNA